MCGIVGYIGPEQAAPILLSGLSKLEYRGYDSAGIAVYNESSMHIDVVKAKGRLQSLLKKTDDGHSVQGHSGIGHTRWATHGEPSEQNAHPHCSKDQTVVLVHNGIIENYQELRQKLLKAGYLFSSETDTEVAVNLIDYYYHKSDSPLEAISKSMLRIKGTYALGILFKNHPGKLYAARSQSPLVIGTADNGHYLASDVPAILSHTRFVYYIDNIEIAEISEKEIRFYNTDLEEITKELHEITWDTEAAEKGGFEHYMLKEIHEQPKAVKDTLHAYLSNHMIDFSVSGLEPSIFEQTKRVYIVGCGSAYHVGIVGKKALEELAKTPVEVYLASEFRYQTPLFSSDSLLIVISQSGETADTLAAMRLAKEHHIPVISIVNVIGSSISRESDYPLYTYAGPEISVATTKAYSAQLILLYLLSIYMGHQKKFLSEKEVQDLLHALEEIPDKIQKILKDKERIQWFASKYASAKNIFFLGRGLDYAISLEGSLKMKEISYIHSEAYAAGELKHGTISLIENGTLVIGLLTQQELFEKTISNLMEAKSRGAYLMGLTSYGNYNIEDTADFSVYVPKTKGVFAGSLAIVPLQLMAYYVSVARGVDVDKPRNLAKSVTVE